MTEINNKAGVQISQMDLVTAIMTHLLKHEGIETLLSRQWNAVIQAANLIVESLQKPVVMSADNMGLKAWLESDDKGLSSKFMAYVLMNGPMAANEYPHDPSDFGRCYRFLKAVPEARERLDLLRRQSKEWDVMIQNWSRLEALWEEESTSKTGMAPKLYAEMLSLRDSVQK